MKNVTIDDVLESLRANHTGVRNEPVEKAYLFAKKAHEGQKRRTGEAWIQHSLRVAKYTAEWGFESDVIMAAVLHDTIKKKGATFEQVSNEFGVKIAQRVNDLSKITKKLTDLDAKNEYMVEIEKGLLEKADKKTLFIKFAEHLDNMANIEGIPLEERPKKAQHTMEVFFPIAKEERAFQIADMLCQMCFQIDDSKEYEKICQSVEHIREENMIETKKTIKLFKDVFTGTEYISPCKCVADFICDDRFAVSIKRQIVRESTNYNEDYEKIMVKENMPIYDMTLILSKDAKNLKDTFSYYYKKALIDEGITIEDYRRTSYGDSNYYILSDRMENRYRLFIRKEIDYMRYRIGNIVDTELSLSSIDSEDINPIGEKKKKKKIKIFFEDGTAHMIDEGATVLDCAFAVHSEVGERFDYARLNGAPKQYGVDKKVKEGDRVEIVMKDYPCAQFKWFRYVKTTKAINFLIRYFEKNARLINRASTKN